MTKDKLTANIGLRVSKDLQDRVDQYQKDNYVNSRSAAIIMLLEQALEKEGYGRKK